jgi:hypothetical protein
LIAHNDGNSEVYSFTSRLHNKDIEPFDESKTYDYNFHIEYACANYTNTNCLYDSYRDYYYIITCGTINYENRDGTTNSPDDAPWSVIVLDKNFHQIDEIIMPKYLSYQHIMITPEGISIQNNKLALKNNNYTGICNL